MPFDYALYLAAQKLGVPPWVLEGYRLDEPPVEWIERVLVFAEAEASVRRTRR